MHPDLLAMALPGAIADGDPPPARCRRRDKHRLLLVSVRPE
jgi:hypothetical protein